MKIVAINGSPRKNGNTAQVLEELGYTQEQIQSMYTENKIK